MSSNESKDIMQRYNEYYEVNEKLRNEKRKKERRKYIIFNIVRYSLIVLIILAIVYPIFKETKEYKDVFFTYNVVEQLNYMYNGDFTIISPTIEEDDYRTPDGLYIIQDNKNLIEFKAYKQKTILTTDYDQYLYKKYILDYIEKNNIQGFFWEDAKQENVNYDLYLFKFGVKINDFSQIDESVNQLFALNKYVNKNVAKHLDFQATNYKPVIILDGFEGYMSQDVTYHDEHYYANKIKIEYVVYLKDNGFVVDSEMIQNYYKPSDMSLFVDGKRNEAYVGNSVVPTHPVYDYSRNDYLVNLGRIMDKMKCIEEYKKENTGKSKYIIYKGNTYYFDDIKEINGNHIPYEWTMTMIQDFFEVAVEYNFDSKTITISTIIE